jgi:lysophospholipase L1-like esterase
MLLLAAFAAVAVLELVVLRLPEFNKPIYRQMRFMVEEHPPGRLRTVAGYAGTQRIGDGTQRVRLNSLGMRGPEYGPKAAGEVRVLFLGDSVTFGTGVEEADAFPVLAAERLSLTVGRRVTAGIAACPGFGIVDQPAFYRRVEAAFDPDLVVSCVFLDNDLYDNLAEDYTVISGYFLFGPAARWAKQSWRARMSIRFQTCYLLETKVLSHVPFLRADSPAAYLSDEEKRIAALLGPDRNVVLLDQKEDVEAVRLLFGRLRDALAEVEATVLPRRLVVLVIPSYVQYIPGVFEHFTQNRPHEGEHERGASQRRVLAICKELDLPAHDLTPALSAHADPKRLVIAGDYHFTPEGNAVVAEAVAGWLGELFGR